MAKPPFELLSNGIIKNLFLNINRQTEALTLILSSGVEREGKNLTAPLTFILSRKWREGNKESFFKEPSPLPSPAGLRGEKEEEDEKI
jgi:hypothetical protein